MLRKINLLGFMFTCSIVWTGLKAKSTHLALKSTKKIPCSQDGQYQQFRNNQGACSNCVDCHKLGLKEKRSCSNYRDAICRNICINRDEEYNKITGACEKPVHQMNSVIKPASKSSAVSSHSTPYDLRSHSTLEPLSVKSRSGPTKSHNHFLKHVAIVCGIVGVVVVAVIPVSVILWKMQRTRKNHIYESIYELNGGESIAGKIKKSVPDTKLRDPSVDPAYKLEDPKNKDRRY